MLGENDDTIAPIDCAIWIRRSAAPFGGLAGFQGHDIGTGGSDPTALR